MILIPTPMDVVNFVFVFVLIWWVVIFMVLPFGNAPSEKSEMERGQAASAPHKPRLRLKFIWASVIALVINIIIFTTIHYTGFQLFGPGTTQ